MARADLQVRVLQVRQDHLDRVAPQDRVAPLGLLDRQDQLEQVQLELQDLQVRLAHQDLQV